MLYAPASPAAIKCVILKLKVGESLAMTPASLAAWKAAAPAPGDEKKLLAVKTIAITPIRAMTEPMRIYSVSFIAAYSRSLTQPHVAINKYMGKIASS